MDEAFKSAVQPGPDRAAPGILLAAANASGSKTLLKTYGSVKLDDPAPLTADTTMWLASFTKPVTAIAVMQCVEKGLFALDSTADVQRLLPEYAAPEIVSVSGESEAQKITTRPAVRTFTLRELLTHSSGLAYDALSFDKLIPWRIGRGEGIKWLCGDIQEAYKTPLIFEPGTSFMYSPGYDWAGQMVERATGLKLDAYFEQHIFQPLGLRTLHFFPEQRPELAARLMPETTRNAPNQPLQDGVIFWAEHAVKTDCIGGAGLYGAPAEFVKVLSALLRNDGKLLSPASVDEMLKGCSPAPARDEFHRLVRSIRDRRAEWCPGVVGDEEWSFGFGGNVLQSEAPGKLGKGAMMWVGLPNLFWVLDREAGYAAVFATQVHPMGEERLDLLKGVWLEEVRKYFA